MIHLVSFGCYTKYHYFCKQKAIRKKKFYERTYHLLSKQYESIA